MKRPKHEDYDTFGDYYEAVNKFIDQLEEKLFQCQFKCKSLERELKYT